MPHLFKKVKSMLLNVFKILVEAEPLMFFLLPAEYVMG